MVKPSHSQRKLFQYFAVASNENSGDVGEKIAQDDLRFLQVKPHRYHDVVVAAMTQADFLHLLHWCLNQK